jgi:glutathione gamma-glutamylcysteinyltransferase
MKEALNAGTAEGSYRLLEQFRTQDEPAYCGLGTLVMALNALDIDPGRIWKGVWRWYSEELLDCCEPLEIIKKQGIIFEKFCCLARCNSASVEAHRPDEDGETIDAFRERLRGAVSCADGPVFVVSYSRKAFGQTGDGHYSTIAAYHEGQDAALILDVARFKLPPHWVPVPLLWEAMQYKDNTTGRCRGYALLSRKPNFEEHRCHDGFILALNVPAWPDLKAALQAAKAKLEKRPAITAGDAFVVLDWHIGDFHGLVRESAEGTCESKAAHVAELEAQAIEYLEGLAARTGEGIFQSPWAGPWSGQDDLAVLSQSAWSDGKNQEAGVSVLYPADVLALPPHLWLPEPLLNSPSMKFLQTSEMPPRLAAEVNRLREQLSDIGCSE